MNLLHYPYYTDVETGQWGVGEHCDYGMLAILLTLQPGLQAKTVSGEWVEVTPIPGTFIINIGDMLQKMTRGLYKSTPHRVQNQLK
jgi:isopenicillin N synthase-like dioxygenase